MELENINLEEVKAFIDSLTAEELKYYDIQAKQILNTSVFIKGVRIDNNLVGIGGIARWYRIFHYPFYVVRSGFQGKGIGSELANSNFAFARKKGIALFLTAVVKENAPSVRILKRQGYRTVTTTDEQNYIFVPFNKRGEIIGKFLPLIVRIYLSPVGNLLRFTRRFYT